MKHENLDTVDCIRTHSGIYVNVFEPNLDMICIEDIAHALSSQPRFGGHLPQFYSVAQHSFICSLCSRKEDKLSALLHDASEAYLMDIPSPIKKRLSNYKEIEDALMVKIAEKFGFEYPMNDRIKKVDRYVLEMEWECLMLQKREYFPYAIWSPSEAKAKFLWKFHNLMQYETHPPQP